jgi:acetyltransferase-like isoleucine patch superfamily enzyme
MIIGMSSLYKEAVCLLESGQYEKALCACNEMLAHNSECADTYSLMGLIEYNRLNMGLAIDRFEQAIALNPAQGAYHYNLGTTLILLGRGNDAIPCFSKSIELQYKTAESCNHLGTILKGLGRLRESATCFEKVLELNPHHSMAVHNLRYMQDNNNIKIDPTCHISPLCSIKSDDTGNIDIGRETMIGDYTRLITSGGSISIGEHCSLHSFCVLYGHGGLTIGDYVRIATHSVIIPSNHNYDLVDIPIYKQGETNKGITIGDDVWIGAGCKILDGVYIGSGVVIGAGSVVTKSIAEYSVVAGVPAKVIKKRGS